MRFGEYLDKTVRIHHGTSQEVANILEINKSTYSKYKNGGSSPRDFSLMYKLAEQLHFSKDEIYQLECLYLEEKEGKLTSNLYQALCRLYVTQDEQQEVLEVCQQPASCNLQTEQALQEAMCYICAEAKEYVKIYIPTDNHDMCEQVRNMLNYAKVPCQMLVNMDDEEASVYNAVSFVEISKIFNIGNLTIHGRVSALETDETMHPFPWFIISEKNVLCITQDGKSGYLLHDELPVEEITKQFDTAYQSGKSYIKNCIGFPEIFAHVLPELLNAPVSDIYVLEKRPCIMMPDDMTQNYVPIYARNTEVEQVAYAYKQFSIEWSKKIRKRYDYFAQDGIELLLTDETYTEMGFISLNVPTSARIQVLNGMIAMSENHTIPLDYHCSKGSLCSVSEYTFMNVLTNGLTLISLEAKSAEQFRCILMNDMSIAKALIAHLKTLENYEIILSDKQTRPYMKKVIAKISNQE